MKDFDAYMLFGAMLAMAGDNGKGVYTEYSSETREEREKRLAEAQERINEAKGMTKFHYGENSLWALNQKSADRKAQTRGWV